MRQFLVPCVGSLLLATLGHAQVATTTQSQIGTHSTTWTGRPRNDDNPNVRTNGNEPTRQYDRMGRACERSNTMTNKAGASTLGADPTACGFDRNGSPTAPGR